MNSNKSYYIKEYELISLEERRLLMNLISIRGCMNCTNASCRVEQNEKVGLDEDGNLQGQFCIGWTNPELIVKTKKLM